MGVGFHFDFVEVATLALCVNKFPPTRSLAIFIFHLSTLTTYGHCHHCVSYCCHLHMNHHYASHHCYRSYHRYRNYAKSHCYMSYCRCKNCENCSMNHLSNCYRYANCHDSLMRRRCCVCYSVGYMKRLIHCCVTCLMSH